MSVLLPYPVGGITCSGGERKEACAYPTDRGWNGSRNVSLLQPLLWIRYRADGMNSAMAWKSGRAMRSRARAWHMSPRDGAGLVTIDRSSQRLIGCGTFLGLLLLMTVVVNSLAGPSAPPSSTNRTSGVSVFLGGGPTASSTLGARGENFLVNFTESGLIMNGLDGWSVVLNGSLVLSESTALGFSEPNGTYSFTVSTSNYSYIAVPSSGTLTVAGDGVRESIELVPVPRGAGAVIFQISGLPYMTQLSVTFNGVMRSGTATIEFDEPNGPYAFSVAPVPGYSTNQSRGSITVNGGTVWWGIHFTATASSGPTVLGLPGWELSTLAGGIVAGVVVGGSVAVLLKRKVKPPTQGVSPNPPQPTGHSPHPQWPVRVR
jgi:hypothetical protein